MDMCHYFIGYGRYLPNNGVCLFEIIFSSTSIKGERKTREREKD